MQVRCIDSDLLQLLVKGKRAEKHVISRASGFKTLVRSVGRKRPSSIARQAMLNDRIRPHILRYLGKRVQKELKLICSKQSGELVYHSGYALGCFAGSLLRQTSLQSFSWDAIISDIEMHAPTLYGVLRVCAEVRKRQKGVKRAHSQVNLRAVIGVCGAVFLRNRSARLVSVVLSAGHASKMVCMFTPGGFP